MQSAKFAICLGSFIAFSMTFFNGIMFGSNFIPVLRDAAIACLLAAVVMKFFVRIIVSNVRSAHSEHSDEVDRHLNNDIDTSESSRPEAATTSADAPNSAA